MGTPIYSIDVIIVTHLKPFITASQTHTITVKVVFYICCLHRPGTSALLLNIQVNPFGIGSDSVAESLQTAT